MVVPLSYMKNMSPTIATATVSETELPTPWKARIIAKFLKSSVDVPQPDDTTSMRDDRTRAGRRPNMFEKGTQKVLPKPKRRILN